MRLLAQESRNPALLFRKAGFLDSITYTCSRKAEGDKNATYNNHAVQANFQGPY